MVKNTESLVITIFEQRFRFDIFAYFSPLRVYNRIGYTASIIGYALNQTNPVRYLTDTRGFG